MSANSMEGVDVVFATPTFDMRPAMEYAACVSSTFYKLSQLNISCALRFRPGLCFVDVARNFLFTEFLEDSQAKDLFFLDDDIGWPADKVLEFLRRPEEVVAGVYPKRQDSVEFPAIMSLDPKNRLITKGDLVQAMFIPFGFVRIKRSAAEKLAKSVKKYVYPDPNNPNGGKREIYEVFGIGLTEQRDYHGEDGWFCDRWRGMGGEIWVDPNISFTHRGQKKWDGNFLPSIQTYLSSQPPADPVSKVDVAKELLSKHGEAK